MTIVSIKYNPSNMERKRKKPLILTFDVTLGFPSRSPPILEPNLIGVWVSGRGLPVCYMQSVKKKDLKLLEGVM